MTVIYISDFFVDEVYGGAELSDDVVIQYIKSRGVELKTVKSQTYDPTIHKADTFIVSNFALLKESSKEWIAENENYIIIERDQKYVRNRNTAEYPGFIAPKSQVVNRDFYISAKKVFCLTGKQMEIMNLHLEIENIESLGCTQFSKQQLQFLSSRLAVEKNNKYAIVPGKRQDKAVAFCEREDIEYEVLQSSTWLKLMDRLCEYKGIVFFSHAFESCCRLLIESKVMGLKIITDNRNGCTYEEWFRKYRGKELLDFLTNKVDETLEKIYSEL